MSKPVRRRATSPHSVPRPAPTLQRDAFGWPAARREGVRLSWLHLQQLQGRDQCRGHQAPPRVQYLNVVKLVRVGQVLAIPGQQVLDTIPRGERQVKGVSQ